MQAFGEKLSNNDTWAVVSYIKGHWPKQVQLRHDIIIERALKP